MHLCLYSNGGTVGRAVLSLDTTSAKACKHRRSITTHFACFKLRHLVVAAVHGSTELHIDQRTSKLRTVLRLCMQAPTVGRRGGQRSASRIFGQSLAAEPHTEPQQPDLQSTSIGLDNMQQVGAEKVLLRSSWDDDADEAQQASAPRLQKPLSAKLHYKCRACPVGELHAHGC